ncbi:MAG: GIN domain-containing protein, partial [Prolixibacteraceae bacterium]
MKRLFFTLFLFVTVFSLFAQEEDANIVKETRTIKDFNKLKVSKGINVTLIKGEEPGAEINIVNAPPADVLIENDKNELTVKMKTRIYKEVSVQVYLTYTDIREITVAS